MRGLLLILAFLVANFSARSQDLSDEEYKLYTLINSYRNSKGLSSIPLSKSLTFVAQTHAKDVINNKPTAGNCNLHSWSGNGNWSSCCYTSDHARAQCMWDKPRELTSYRGNGYEISHGSTSSSYKATAEGALNGWKSSLGHNEVIINRGKWHDNYWQAIGIGIHEGYACVWFGEEKDRNTSYNQSSGHSSLTGSNIHTQSLSNRNDIRLKPYNWCFKFGYQMFSHPISTDLFKTSTVQGVFNETSRSMYSNFTFGIYKKFGIKERPRRSLRERYVEAGISFRDRSWSDLVGFKYEFIAAPPLSFSQNTQERLSFNSRLSIDVMLAKFLNLGVGAAFLTDYTALPQSLFSPSVGMTFPVWRFNLTGHFHYFTNFNQVSLWNFSGGVLYNINFGRSARR